MSEDLPPSALYVLDVVDREGPVSRQELLEETELCERTLDRALDRLQNVGEVTLARDSDDLREVVAKPATMPTYNPSRE